MDYSEIKQKYDDIKKFLPVNHIRPRFGNLRDKENEHFAPVILRWLEIMTHELQPLIKVITCIPAERWQQYEKLGHTAFPEYLKRRKLEIEFRALWNELMPPVLKPRKQVDAVNKL